MIRTNYRRTAALKNREQKRSGVYVRAPSSNLRKNIIFYESVPRTFESKSRFSSRTHVCENIIGTINYLRGHTGNEQFAERSFVSLVKFGIFVYVGRHMIFRDIFVSPACLSPHKRKDRKCRE